MDNASPWQAMARATQAEARDIVAELDIEGHWRRAGAVFMPWPVQDGLAGPHWWDIDFHVHTPTLDRDLSFRVMAALASSPYLNSLHFVDGSATEERCLEWHGIWQRPAVSPANKSTSSTSRAARRSTAISNALPTVFAGAWTIRRGIPSCASNTRRRKTRASTGWNTIRLFWKAVCAL